MSSNRSYVAQKKDIKTLLDNPKITFVLGKPHNIPSLTLNRRSRFGQGHPVRQTRGRVRLHAHLRGRPDARRKGPSNYNDHYSNALTI